MDLIAGTILLGKELNPSNNLKHPRSIYNKNCLKNQTSIRCDTSGKWCHMKSDEIGRASCRERV